MTTDAYRELLRELTAARADRVRGLQELAAFDAEQSRVVPRQIEDAMAAGADQHFQTAKYELEQQHAETCRAIEEDYRCAETIAVSDFTRRTGELDLQFEADLATAEKKYKEDSWLVQSILDDEPETGPKVQWERLQAHWSRHENDLPVRMPRFRRSMIRRSLWRPAGGSVWKAEPQPGPMPATRDEAELQIASAVDGVRHGAQRLARQMVPRLFAGWLVVIPLFLAITGVIFAAVFVGVQPTWFGITKLSRAEWAAIAGGIGATVSICAMLILSQIAARKSALVLEPLQQHAVNARAWHQRWLKFADADLRAGSMNTRPVMWPL